MTIPRFAFALLALLATALIAGADFASGAGIKPAILYVVPVVLASWFSRVLGALVAVAAVALWLASDVALSRDAALVALSVNSLMRLLVFLLASLLAAGYRERLEESERLALVDPLTGLPNRRAFTDRAEREVARARRSQRPLSLAYIDVDEFKRVNDEHGHEAGDRVLRTIGEVLKTRVRASDLPARLGGDELAILLTDTDTRSARSAVQTLHRQLEQSLSHFPFPVRVSIGLAGFDSAPLSADELLRAADHEMYATKRLHRANRNRSQEPRGRPDADPS